MSSSALPAARDLLIKRLSDRATLPTRGSKFAAGLDLYAAESKTVPANGKALIDTQLSMAIPYGTYGRIAPRSGLAAKHSIQTGAGVIDADYRGTLFVLLFNHSSVDYSISQGDRIAQLILEKVEMSEVKEVDDLEATLRGQGGFGSTGGFSSSSNVLSSTAPAPASATAPAPTSTASAAAPATEGGAIGYLPVM